MNASVMQRKTRLHGKVVTKSFSFVTNDRPSWHSQYSAFVSHIFEGVSALMSSIDHDFTNLLIFSICITTLI